MKLSKIQIEALYDFTRRHFVEHYDLQTELVDHLANGIEAQWIENPKCSFDEALQREFNKFGVYGFSSIISKKQNALTKKYWKIILKHIKEWFLLPKILLTVTLFLCFYGLLNTDFGKDFLEAALIIITALMLISFGINFHKFKKQKSYNKKRWLLEEIVFTTGGIISFTFLPLQAFHFFINTDKVLYEHPTAIFIISSVLTLLLLSGYIIFKLIPERIETILLETYPEYKFEKSM